MYVPKLCVGDQDACCAVLNDDEILKVSPISVYMSPLIKKSSLACGLLMGCRACGVLKCVNKIRTLGRDL